MLLESFEALYKTLSTMEARRLHEMVATRLSDHYRNLRDPAKVAEWASKEPDALPTHWKFMHGKDDFYNQVESSTYVSPLPLELELEELRAELARTVVLISADEVPLQERYLGVMKISHMANKYLGKQRLLGFERSKALAQTCLEVLLRQLHHLPTAHLRQWEGNVIQTRANILLIEACQDDIPNIDLLNGAIVVHLPLIQLVMDARFQFDMPVTEGSCPPGWFSRSVQSSDKAQSKRAPSFYFVESNVASAITEEIRNDERSNMGDEDFCRVFYELRQGFHPRSLLPVDETWKCSLRLFQLIRGYRSDAKFDTCFLQNMYELVKEELKDTVRRNLQSLTGWRLGDPIHHLIILNILTLSLSAAIFVQLFDSQEIAGSLESLKRSVDDMVKLFTQGPDGRAVVVEERISFLWARHGAVLTTCLIMESDLLPPY